MIPAWKVYFKVAWACKTPFVFLLDSKYKEIEQKVLGYIGRKVSRAFDYVTDFSDCDDAAIMFKAEAGRLLVNGVGIVVGWSRGFHVWNVVLLDGSVRHVEPQTGKIVEHRHYRSFVAVI